MKPHEAKEQEARVSQYRVMEQARDRIVANLEIIKGTGDATQPFTMGSRDSRRISDIQIWFTETCGGAPPVNMKIKDLHIEAWRVGRALESALLSKLTAIAAEMEEL